MFAYGRVDRIEGRCCFNSAEIIDENGEVMSTATGVYVRVDQLKDKLPAEEYMRQVSMLTDNDPREL